MHNMDIRARSCARTHQVVDDVALGPFIRSLGVSARNIAPLEVTLFLESGFETGTCVGVCGVLHYHFSLEHAQGSKP